MLTGANMATEASMVAVHIELEEYFTALPNW